MIRWDIFFSRKKNWIKTKRILEEKNKFDEFTVDNYKLIDKIDDRERLINPFRHEAARDLAAQISLLDRYEN